MDGQFWDCTREEYDASDRLRSSTLKDFRISRKTYQWRHVLKKMGRREESKEMLFGTMGHALVLEGLVLWSIAGRCEGKYGSGARKGQQCTNHGSGTDADGKWLCKTHSKNIDVTSPENLITTDQQDALAVIQGELEASDCAYLLEDHYAENAIVWTDGKTGIECKALPDILRFDGSIVDLKFTGEFNAESIWRKIERLGWGFSMAFYELGVRHIPNMNRPVDWKLILCETIPPYRVQEFPVPEDYQDVCRKDVRDELIGLAECRESGVYKDKPLEVGTPQWIHFSREDRGHAR